MKIEQIIELAHASKYWTKGDSCTVVDNAYLPEFVEACHQAKLRETKPYEYIHNEHIGNGVFDIIRMHDGEMLFSYLDKHGYFNVFNTMSEFAEYLDGTSIENRVCIKDEQLDESDPDYEEGVDALDRYLMTLV